MIKIGVGVPLTGMGAELGREMAQAVQLAIEEANTALQSDGVRLEAWIFDDKGTEAESQRGAGAFAADPSVVAVVGHYNSNATLAAAPIYDRAGLALIAPIVSNPKLTQSGWRNVFRFTNRDDSTAAASAAHVANSLAKRRAALVATETVYGASMGNEFAHAFEKCGGKILQRHLITEGDKEFVNLIGHLPSEMDVLFYGGTFEGAPLLKQMRDARLPQLFATGDGCWDVGNFLEPAGQAAEDGEGVLVLSACPELGRVTGSSEFASRYEKRFGPVRNYAINSYDAATMLTKAISAAAKSGASAVNRGSVLDALRRTQYRGIAYPGTVTWDENGDNTAAVTALHVVRSGKFRQVAIVPRD